MPDYRAYVLDKTGHVIERHDLDAADDGAALKHASQYVDGRDVEVWQLGRVVKVLKGKE